jgi:hypothetical protein
MPALATLSGLLLSAAIARPYFWDTVKNSLVVVGAVVVLAMVVAFLAAVALAKYRFTGNKLFDTGGLGTGPDGAGVVVAGRFGSLHVTTTLLKPGYLRRNGIPYSAAARLTEDFDFRTEDDGTEWFTVTSVVEDPTYLASPFVTSTDFKKEPDGSKWRPRSCSDY